MADESHRVSAPPGALDRAARWSALGLGGATVWFTGLSGAGKSTIALAVERALVAAGRPCYRLDGDELRLGLNADLGFDDAARHENVRRVAEVARLFADAGLVSLVALISPFAAGRGQARRLHEEAGLTFVEVFVDTPVDQCAARDPKGLYRDARTGSLSHMTGVSAPYEPPERPDLVVGGARSVEASAAAVLEVLVALGAAARPI